MALSGQRRSKLINTRERVGFYFSRSESLTFCGIDNGGAIEVAFSKHCLERVTIAGLGSHDATHDALCPLLRTQSQIERPF